MADEAAVKKQLEADRAAADESRRAGDEKLSKGKPTPTQEENDRAKLGEHVLEKEDDGSGPDPNIEQGNEAQRGAVQGRAMGPAPMRSGYQTRASAPATPQPSREK